MFEKVVYSLTFIAWVASIATIATLGVDFAAQAPLCIVSTIVIFTLATFAIKWKERRKSTD